MRIGKGVVALGLLLAASTAARGQARKEKKPKSSLLDYFDPRTPDREAARTLAPVTLGDMAPRRATGQGRVLRLRVYADDDYRGATLSWQKKVERQLDRVNRVVEPIFNVRFELESARKWGRSHTGVALQPLVDELEALDPGQDVDWVVGYVTAFRGVATSIHQVGMADLVSKHFVMRGMDDQEEGRALESSFKLLPVGERETLYADRKAHKELVIFLHEWAHTLGGMHAEVDSLVMNPTYDPRQTGFSDFEAQCIGLALERRLADRAQAYPESAELLALVKKAPTGEGSDAERALLRRVLESRAGNASGRGSVELPAADASVYNAAVAALDAGRVDEAWTKAAPLFATHPRAPRVLGLACAMVAGHAKAGEAGATCDAAIKLAPKDTGLLLSAAAAHARAHAPEAAIPYLNVAVSKLLAAGATTDDAILVRVARIAMEVGAFSMADDALARASKGSDDARKALTDLETNRRRSVLPRDLGQSGVAPEREAEYVNGSCLLAADASKQDARTWQARFVAFEARFPDAPGTKTLACGRELKAHHGPAASKLCQAALAKYPEAVRAQYLMGVIAESAHRDFDAEKSYRKALLLDPEDALLWRELATFYKTRRAGQKLDQLGQQHEALLSRPLPE